MVTHEYETFVKQYCTKMHAFHQVISKKAVYCKKKTFLEYHMRQLS